MEPAYFAAVLCAACFYALWKGGTPERLVSVIILVGVAWSALFRFPYHSPFGVINIGIWSADIVVFIALIATALHSERYWTIWMSSFQLVQVISHLPELLIPHLLPGVHLLIISLWIYPMLIILIAGTLRHTQRMKTFGTDRSWSDFSQPQV